MIPEHEHHSVRDLIVSAALGCHLCCLIIENSERRQYVVDRRAHLPKSRGFLSLASYEPSPMVICKPQHSKDELISLEYWIPLPQSCDQIDLVTVWIEKTSMTRTGPAT